MSFINRWDPFRETVALRDVMNRLIEDSFVRPRWTQQDGGNVNWSTLQLPLDAYSTKDWIVTTAPVPGVKPEDVETTVEGDALTIRGTVPAPIENVNYLIQERAFGRFSRTLVLNVPVQADKANAEFRDGVLTITVPKAEAVRPRSIKVNTVKTP